MSKTVSSCAFYNCSNNRKNNKKLKFFHFRKHDYETWIQVCNNPHLNNLNLDTLIKNYDVCANHFTRNDYEIIIPEFHGDLRKDAIPKNTG